jgi:hypothetical protein
MVFAQASAASCRSCRSSHATHQARDAQDHREERPEATERWVDQARSLRHGVEFQQRLTAEQEARREKELERRAAAQHIVLRGAIAPQSSHTMRQLPARAAALEESKQEEARTALTSSMLAALRTA